MWTGDSAWFASCDGSGEDEIMFNGLRESVGAASLAGVVIDTHDGDSINVGNGGTVIFFLEVMVANVMEDDVGAAIVGTNMVLRDGGLLTAAVDTVALTVRRREESLPVSPICATVLRVIRRGGCANNDAMMMVTCY